MRTLTMWITQHLAARTLVWLAAVAIPMQSLQSAASGCACLKTCFEAVDRSQGSCCASGQPSPGRCSCTGAMVCRCGETSPCHRQAHACCSGQRAKASCCSGGRCSPTRDGTCPCGANCHCGENNVPEAPATPPVENYSPERIVAASASAVSCAIVHQLVTTRQHLDVCAAADALSALERCVTLCRFTI